MARKKTSCEQLEKGIFNLKLVYAQERIAIYFLLRFTQGYY